MFRFYGNAQRKSVPLCSPYSCPAGVGSLNLEQAATAGPIKSTSQSPSGGGGEGEEGEEEEKERKEAGESEEG